jgi:hypothetical protein
LHIIKFILELVGVAFKKGGTFPQRFGFLFMLYPCGPQTLGQHDGQLCVGVVLRLFEQEAVLAHSIVAAVFQKFHGFAPYCLAS